MPVVGSDPRGRGQADSFFIELPKQNVEQRTYSAKKMRAMCGSENIEKAARRIGRHENALSNKLAPRHKLADQKQNAKPGRHCPQIAKTEMIEAGKGAARALQRKTAQHKRRRVSPQKLWEMNANPISIPSNSFSGTYLPDWWALITCSGARCCGTKSSATSGTLNS